LGATIEKGNLLRLKGKGFNMTIVVKPLREQFLTSNWLHLRFMAQNALFASSAVGLLVGGAWVWLPFVLANILISAIDEFSGDDRLHDASPPFRLHSANLLLGVVLLAMNVTFFAYHFTNGDPLSLVRALMFFGIDFDAARRATSPVDLVLAIVAQGFIYSVAMSSCHELLHCTGSPFRMFLSRWVSALVLDPWFLIHHIGHHHRYVGLPQDVDTPQRGMSVYAFMARAVPANTLFCSRFERERLAKRGGYWSLENRFLTGWAILAAVAAFFFAIGGVKALAAYFVSGTIGRLLLDATGYLQHYGVVRVEGEPVHPRLSWDVYRLGTNALLNDIGRHADHHDHPLKPSVDLHVAPAAPQLPYGYLKLIGFALVPPLYFRIMQPHLDEWDRKYATDADIAFMRTNGISCIAR
jgi:alkane 1-monooxygenase